MIECTKDHDCPVPHNIWLVESDQEGRQVFAPGAVDFLGMPLDATAWQKAVRAVEAGAVEASVG